jgi:hypothetical protein
MENASRRYSSDEVKRMIEKHKEKDKWEFLFIGANIDAIETASHFGIDEDKSVNYHADREGTRVVYTAMAQAVKNVRASAPLSREWKDDINADFESRK